MPARFHIDDIEEHSDNCLPSQHQTMDPVSMPSYFSSMLYMNHTGMWKISRPITHELISPDDEIIWLTRRTQHTCSGAWLTFIPIDNNYHRQSNSCSPSLSFSLSSLPLNKEERQIHHPAGKYTDLASIYSSDSSDLGTDDTWDTAFVWSPTTFKIPKPGSSHLSRIMRWMKDPGVWYLHPLSKISTDNSLAAES